MVFCIIYQCCPTQDEQLSIDYSPWLTHGVTLQCVQHPEWRNRGPSGLLTSLWGSNLAPPFRLVDNRYFNAHNLNVNSFFAVPQGFWNLGKRTEGHHLTPGCGSFHVSGERLFSLVFPWRGIYVLSYLVQVVSHLHGTFKLASKKNLKGK